MLSGVPAPFRPAPIIIAAAEEGQEWPLNLRIAVLLTFFAVLNFHPPKYHYYNVVS